MKHQPHTTLRDLATLGCFSITPRKWADGMVPHRPEYGLDLMRAILCGYYGVGAYKLTDCTLVQDGKVVG